MRLYLACLAVLFIAFPAYAEPTAYNFTTSTWYACDDTGYDLIGACSDEDEWGIGSDYVLIPISSETATIEIVQAGIMVQGILSGGSFQVLDRWSNISRLRWSHPRCNFKVERKYHWQNHARFKEDFYIEVE
ncbi:hypothetical protein N9104_01740 [Pseudomonadales bacterium]|nr:hypothetical protein [Pseudomonadales bacterium]